MNLLILLSGFWLPSSAGAVDLDPSVQMSFHFLRSEVSQAYPRGTGLPDSPAARLPKTVRDALDSHLAAVTGAANRSGITYRRAGRLLEILPGTGSSAARKVQELMGLGLKKVVYDPVYLANYSVVGAFDSRSLTLFTTIHSVATGEVDSVLHHEVVHAMNALSPSRIPRDLQMVFRSLGNRDLRPDAVIYPRRVSADELSAYVAELRFLLADPEATTEVQGDSGVTRFRDKADLLNEVVKTLEVVTGQALRQTPTTEGSQVRYEAFALEWNCSACERAAGSELRALVQRLNERSTAMKQLLLAESLSPEALVAQLESILK